MMLLKRTGKQLWSGKEWNTNRLMFWKNRFKIQLDNPGIAIEITRYRLDKVYSSYNRKENKCEESSEEFPQNAVKGDKYIKTCERTGNRRGE